MSYRREPFTTLKPSEMDPQVLARCCAKTLTGHDAIAYAETHGLPVCKYADPIECARHDLTPQEAREVAKEDPSLLWIKVRP